jgi:hypothetical protein
MNNPAKQKPVTARGDPDGRADDEQMQQGRRGGDGRQRREGPRMSHLLDHASGIKGADDDADPEGGAHGSDLRRRELRDAPAHAEQSALQGIADLHESVAEKEGEKRRQRSPQGRRHGLSCIARSCGSEVRYRKVQPCRHGHAEARRPKTPFLQHTTVRQTKALCLG